MQNNVILVYQWPDMILLFNVGCVAEGVLCSFCCFFAIVSIIYFLYFSRGPYAAGLGMEITVMLKIP